MAALMAAALLPATAPAQPARTAPQKAGAASAAAARAEAYRAFLEGRRLEAADQTEAALAAFTHAIALVPDEAEFHAELAGFHARQDRATEAVASAERAVALDAASEEGHRVLAMVYAAWAEGEAPPPKGTAPSSWRDKAIAELEALRDAPGMATDLTLRLAHGRLLLRAGRADAAVPVLQKVAAEASYAAEPSVLLAEAYSSLGQAANAAEALADAARLAPRYYAPLGDLYERLGRPADAAAAYERALAQSKGQNRELRLRFARALLGQGDESGATRARDLLREATAAGGIDRPAFALLAEAHRRLGERADAERVARRLVDSDPAGLAGRSVLAGLLEDRQDYRGIVDLLAPVRDDLAARAKGRADEAALLMAQLGGAYLQLARRPEAEEALLRARELGPDVPGYAALLAETYVQGRRFDDAGRVAREARAAHPADRRLLRLEARALARAGDAASAIALGHRVLGVAPTGAADRLTLADILADAGQPAQAVALVAPLAAAATSDRGLTFRVAALHEAAGQVAEAEALFRRLIAETPTDAVALNYLGYMLGDRGQRLPEALALVDRALAVEPDNPSYLDSRGWILFRMKRVTDAEAALRRAAAALPANSVVQAHHADALAALGRRDEAAAAWQRALDGDGEDIDRAAIERRVRATGRVPR